MKAVRAFGLLLGCSVAAAQQRETFSKLVRHFCRSLDEGDESANETLANLPEEVQIEVQALCIALSASCRERYECSDDSRDWNGTETGSVCAALNATRMWASTIQMPSRQGGGEQPAPEEEEAEGSEQQQQGACSQIERVAVDWGGRQAGAVDVGPVEECEERSTEGGGPGGSGDGTGASPSGTAPAPASGGTSDDERMSRFPGEELLTQCTVAASLQQTEEQPERGPIDSDTMLFLAIGLGLVLVATGACIVVYIIQRRRKAKKRAESKCVEEEITSSNRLPARGAAGKV